jgi:hypothetical protein
MQAQVGASTHEDGSGVHVNALEGTPASAGAIAGGCSSQIDPAAHLVMPQANVLAVLPPAPALVLAASTTTLPPQAATRTAKDSEANRIACHRNIDWLLTAGRRGWCTDRNMVTTGSGTCDGIGSCNQGTMVCPDNLR